MAKMVYIFSSNGYCIFSLQITVHSALNGVFEEKNSAVRVFTQKFSIFHHSHANRFLIIRVLIIADPEYK